jgi:hypothetical protein
MKNMKNVARIAILPMAGSALFGCASLSGDSPVWQPSPGTQALGADLRPTVGYYESAVSAINGRHYALALDYLQAARAANADDVRVLTAFGVVYDKLGRFDLSARYYAQAAALDPKSMIIAADVDYSHHLQILAEGPAAVAANASNGGTGAWQPAQVAARGVPTLPDVSGSIATAVNIPNMTPDAAAADETPLKAPWLLAANAAPSNTSGWRPVPVTAPDVSVLSNAGGNIATAVNIPKMTPEASAAEEMPLQAPWVLAANAAPSNTSAWHPVQVAARGVPALADIRGNIATAVNIPKMTPEAAAAEEAPLQTPWVLAANAAPSNTSAWHPVPVTARGVPALADIRGNIATAVNIPTMTPEAAAAEEAPLQAPWVLAANAAPSNTSPWHPVLVTSWRAPALPNVSRNIATAVHIPKMATNAAAAWAKPSQTVPVHTVSTAPSNSGDRRWHPVPTSERLMPAVPSLNGRVVAALKVPQLRSKTFVADAKPLQTPKLQTVTRGRTIILTGHPLVLVNASGHGNTPMSVGHRLSGLGWTVSKSIEPASRLQAKTTIVYQKSKFAAAMALARTLSLVPRLVASETAIGLRLVLGSDLSPAMFKGRFSHAPGKRVRVADSSNQSRE